MGNQDESGQCTTMSQSLARLYVHLIFSTKDRRGMISDSIRPPLHDYFGGILKGLKCAPVEINSEADHAHLLFVLPPTQSLSGVVGQAKKSATEWLRRQGPKYSGFSWQNGYGAFSVSQSGVERVREYIRNQRAHHRRVSFQDELRTWLRRYDMDFDERYLWD
jgi:putative transposase